MFSFDIVHVQLGQIVSISHLYVQTNMLSAFVIAPQRLLSLPVQPLFPVYAYLQCLCLGLFLPLAEKKQMTVLNSS